MIQTFAFLQTTLLSAKILILMQWYCCNNAVSLLNKAKSPIVFQSTFGKLNLSEFCLPACPPQHPLASTVLEFISFKTESLFKFAFSLCFLRDKESLGFLFAGGFSVLIPAL